MTESLPPPDVHPLAWAAMVGYCGWDPLENLVEQPLVLSGDGRRELFLPSLRVTDVSAVTVDGIEDTLTIGNGNDIGWEENGILTWNRRGVWPWGQRNITVTYSSGWGATSAAVLRAALKSMSKRMPAVEGGIGTRKMGTASLTMTAAAAAGQMLDIEMMVFDRYAISTSR